ncbi:MAG: hypothetical protein ACFBSC_01715 [Microcoleaceae cyanobacterium]
MGTAFRYWKLLRLRSSGQSQEVEILQAKELFTVIFPDIAANDEVSDTRIQQDLLNWRQNPSLLNQYDHDITSVELCLLCFISWEIEQVCSFLELKYGVEHNFTRQDLYPLVLDEQGNLPTNQDSSYRSLSREILDSFDPAQSSLATWTNRKVKSYPELTSFLLERGIYLVSNWAILNDTRPQQLERILSRSYYLAPDEVTFKVCLLSSYHEVYRTQRIQQRKAGSKRPCQPPTAEQYQQIAQKVSSQLNYSISPRETVNQLRELAEQLRDYRVYVRSGQLRTQSLGDTSQQHSDECAVDPIDQLDEGPDTRTDFLEVYRRLFLDTLNDSIQAVIDARMAKLGKRSRDKSRQFLKALGLFHCEGRSMGEIAKKLGLKAQCNVSRLLNLKAFRADIRQKLLTELRERIAECASNYVDLQELEEFDQKIEAALDEQISQVIDKAESESHVSSNRPTDSLFSQQLCQQIDSNNS